MPQLLKCFQVIHKFCLALFGLLFKLLKHFQRKCLSPQLFPILLQFRMNSGARSNGKLKVALHALQIRGMTDEILSILLVSYYVDTTTKFTLLVCSDDLFSSIQFRHASQFMFSLTPLIRSREGLGEGEGKGRWTMSTQEIQALLHLSQIWYMSGWNPPQGYVWAIELYKPLSPPAHNLCMRAFVHERFERV